MDDFEKTLIDRLSALEEQIIQIGKNQFTLCVALKKYCDEKRSLLDG